MHRPVVVLAAVLAASTMVGCAAGPAAAVRHSPPASTTDAPAAPIPADELRRLPQGVFYLLAGPHLNELNVWEVSSAGVQEQLTHNQPGYEIDGMAASTQGIILADSLPGYDQLARWTSRGPAWLHPRGHPAEQIAGQVPDISAGGKITYELPPHDRQGATDSKNFTFWVRGLFNGGPERMVYQHKSDPGNSLFGPGGQVAIIGPVGKPPAGQHPGIVIISRSGAIRRIRTPPQAYHQAWGRHAPALVVSSLAGPALAFYPGGRRQMLPDDWQPLAWNQSGSSLLMKSGLRLGIWSPRHPHDVTPVSSLSKGFEVEQVTWLDKPARI